MTSTGGSSVPTTGGSTNPSTGGQDPTGEAQPSRPVQLAEILLLEDRLQQADLLWILVDQVL